MILNEQSLITESDLWLNYIERTETESFRGGLLSYVILNDEGKELFQTLAPFKVTIKSVEDRTNLDSIVSSEEFPEWNIVLNEFFSILEVDLESYTVLEAKKSCATLITKLLPEVGLVP